MHWGPYCVKETVTAFDIPASFAAVMDTDCSMLSRVEVDELLELLELVEELDAAAARLNGTVIMNPPPKLSDCAPSNHAWA